MKPTGKRPIDKKPFTYVYENRPKAFQKASSVVGCFLEIEGKLLLLQRSETESEKGCWGPPAGTVEKGESLSAAAKRELSEETGIIATKVALLGPLYIQKPHVAYVFYLFAIQWDKNTDVTTSSEHTDYKWISLEKARSLPLVSGGTEALTYYQKKKTR